MPVENEHRFETDRGTQTLAELFDGRKQLLVYHFIFGPEYTAGCPICSAAADCFDGAVVHLNHRGVRFVCVSRAQLEKLQAYKRRMAGACRGSPLSAVTSTSASGVTFTDEQQREEAEYNYRTFEIAPILDSTAGTPLNEIAAPTGTGWRST